MTLPTRLPRHIAAPAIVLAIAFATTAAADPPVIEAARANETGGTWRFDVTLSHPDTGWQHYADGWRVLDMQGNVLGMRVLHHPHVEEQPFTRSLSGIVLPAGTEQVQIEAHCLTDGWGANRLTLTLPGSITD